MEVPQSHLLGWWCSGDSGCETLQPLKRCRGIRGEEVLSRGIIGAANPGRFARTSWWWTQSGQTGLRGLLLPADRRELPDTLGCPGRAELILVRVEESRVWHPDWPKTPAITSIC